LHRSFALGALRVEAPRRTVSIERGSQSPTPRTVKPPAPKALDGLRVIASLPTAVLVVDALGTILMANRRAARILERGEEALRGARVEEVLGPLHWHQDASMPPEVGELRSSLSVTLPRGRAITIGYGVGVVAGVEEGDPLLYAIVFQNISNSERVREERDRLLRLAAVGDVLPSVLHELKNPLAAVTTAVEVLLEELPDGSVRDQLHAVLGEVRRMKLAFEGVGAAGRALRSDRFHAVDLACREVFRILTPRMEAVGVVARCDVPDMPLLPLDPAVVRAVLFNLLVNSMHSCRSGGTVVVHARLVDEGRRFELTVADTGEGMTAEVYERCTELFYTTKRSGSGIGLALARRAAEGAGGALDIQSIIGVGTTVTVRVPVT
jgi:signal transduction histidine kinase